MRLGCICMFCLVAPTVALATSSSPGDCALRLDQTLAVMQDRPLQKEEHATALMWLRMDAQEAIAAGNEIECMAKVAVVERLLGAATTEK